MVYFGDQAVELLRRVNIDIVDEDGSGDTVYVVQEDITNFLATFDNAPGGTGE